MKRLLLISIGFYLALLLFAATSAQPACPCTVSGRVVHEASPDPADPFPIQGLSVYLVDLEGERFPEEAVAEESPLNITDAEGRFTIEDVPALDTPYVLEIYSGTTLLFRDIISIDEIMLELEEAEDAEADTEEVLLPPIRVVLR